MHVWIPSFVIASFHCNTSHRYFQVKTYLAMGGCCSQPAPEMRYVVHDDGEGPSAERNAPPPPIAPEVVAPPPPPPPPIVEGLHGDVLKAIERKENAFRAQVLSDEFKLRDQLIKTRLWGVERIAEEAAQRRRLEEAAAAIRLSLDADIDVENALFDDDLIRTTLIAEECVMIPAAMEHEVLVREDMSEVGGTTRSRQSWSPHLSPFRGGGSLGGRGSSVDSLPRAAGDMLEDILNEDCALPCVAFMAAPKLQFRGVAWDEDGRSRSSSPFSIHSGKLFPFAEGVCMEMLPDLVLPSASESRNTIRRSLVRELNHDGRRHDVLEGDPITCLILDEVDNRDLVERYAHRYQHEIWLLETQERAFRCHLAFGRGLIQSRTLTIRHAWERWETHDRLQMEAAEFLERMEIWERADLRITSRRAYERQVHDMKLRDKEREARSRADAAVEIAKLKKVERLKWEMERNRIQGGTVRAKEKLFADLQAARTAAAAAAVHGDNTAADDTNLSLNADASSNASSSKSYIPRRLVRERKEQWDAFCAEEARWRQATVIEEQHCWEGTMDSIIRQAPTLLSAPTLREVLSVKQQLELAEAQQELQRIQRRLMAEVSVKAHKEVQQRLDRLDADLAVTRLEEEKTRKSLAHQEALYRAMLMEEGQEEWEVHHTHDLRRQAEEDALQAIADQQAHEVRCIALLNAVGRGYRRRRQLGVVYPVGVDVAYLVEEHRRTDKHTKMMENVTRGDIMHYFVLESKLVFSAEWVSRSIPDSSMYPWTADCLPPVEAMKRDLLESAWLAELLTNVWGPFETERKIIARIPKAVSQRRVSAATSIQRAWRSFVLRREFNRRDRDRLLLQRERGKKMRSESRLLFDVEKSSRADIEEEYFNTDWHTMKKNLLDICMQRWTAAVAIERVYRGWRARTKTIPLVVEAHLRQRLHRSQAKLSNQVSQR